MIAGKASKKSLGKQLNGQKMMFDWKHYSGFRELFSFGGTIQVCKKTRLVQVTDIIETMWVMREKRPFSNRQKKNFHPTKNGNSLMISGGG
jgi:hypothetical protein